MSSLYHQPLSLAVYDSVASKETSWLLLSTGSSQLAGGTFFFATTIIIQALKENRTKLQYVSFLCYLQYTILSNAICAPFKPLDHITLEVHTFNCDWIQGLALQWNDRFGKADRAGRRASFAVFMRVVVLSLLGCVDEY